MSKGLNIIETGKIGARRVVDNINDRVNHGVELRTIDVFVARVSCVIAAGKIDGSNAKFRRSCYRADFEAKAR